MSKAVSRGVTGAVVGLCLVIVGSVLVMGLAVGEHRTVSLPGVVGFTMTESAKVTSFDFSANPLALALIVVVAAAFGAVSGAMANRTGQAGRTGRADEGGGKG